MRSVGHRDADRAADQGSPPRERALDDVRHQLEGDCAEVRDNFLKKNAQASRW